MASKSPFAKNAKTILTRSLEDIQAGNWKRQTWGGGKANGKCEIDMGCANGLISMHGGHVSYEGETTDGKYRYISPVPANASAYNAETRTRDEAPSGVVKATKAVFKALPKSYQQAAKEQLDEYHNDLSELDVMVDTIIDWNDQGTTTQRKAATVFRKAIELLPTIK